MRRLLIAPLLCIFCIPLSAWAEDSKPQECVRKGKKACEVVIDRANPASPDKIVVAAGTEVTIRLANARINEAVAFTPKTAQTPPPNLGETFLKGALDVLKNPIFSIKSLEQPAPPPPPDQHAQHTQTSTDPIAAALESSEDELAKALILANDSGVWLSCLSAYRDVDGVSGAYYCKAESLDDYSFEWAKIYALKALSAAAEAPLPFATLQDVDKRIKADIEKSLAITNAADRAKALAKDDSYLSRLNTLSLAADDANKAQAALMVTAAKLQALVTLPQVPTFTISEAKNYTSAIDVSAQEVLSGTKTSLATVNIVWQSNPWEISTGIMFSTLKNRTFTNVAVFENGAPQLDSDGKTLTMVQESVKQPAVLFPVVMVHYRIPSVNWLMASGGVGLNLGTTTAEFTLGPSFKIFGLIFSPAVHFGRETELAQGVRPSSKLGVDPPDPPTETHWVKDFRWGVAVSYAIPIP